MLSIGELQGDPISYTLSSIFDKLETYDDSVWKGFTCREDTFGNPEYLLWVEPGLGGKIPQQSIRNFRIGHRTALQGGGSPFLAVVNIKVFVI